MVLKIQNRRLSLFKADRDFLPPLRKLANIKVGQILIHLTGQMSAVSFTACWSDSLLRCFPVREESRRRTCKQFYPVNGKAEIKRKSFPFHLNQSRILNKLDSSKLSCLHLYWLRPIHFGALSPTLHSTTLI